jgi:hypothetical protein
MQRQTLAVSCEYFPGRGKLGNRRTLTDAGFSEIPVAALLGHRVAAGVTARYIHPDRDPLHQAADVTSATIAAAHCCTVAESLPWIHRRCLAGVRAGIRAPRR